MRVLVTEGSDREDWVPHLCTHRDKEPYAILSHRWYQDANDEVLFADIEEIDRTVIGTNITTIKNAQYAGGIASTKPGYNKIQRAARQALNDGYDYIWIDTCCVDKTSSAELSEAINSMFKWYSHSDACYAYLRDVPTTDTLDGSAFTASQWWTRGWTLQELVAPYNLLFFSTDWRHIGERGMLATKIAAITGIDAALFRPLGDHRNFSVAQRMSWASSRTTTRPEDMSYCLMGLFDVNMPLLYGEGGGKAFIRLQQEIIKDLDDESIFAWRDEPKGLTSSYGSMLATSPIAFAGSREIARAYESSAATGSSEAFSMTNKGLSISLPLFRAPPSLGLEDNMFLALLSCTVESTQGKRLGIILERLYPEGIQYTRRQTQHWIEVEQLFHYDPMTSQYVQTIFVRQSWDGKLRVPRSHHVVSNVPVYSRSIDFTLLADHGVT